MGNGAGGCKCKENFLGTPATGCKSCNETYPNSQTDGSGGCICRNNYVGNPPSTACILCNSTDTNSQGNGAGLGCKCKNNFFNYTNPSSGLTSCTRCNTTYPNSIGDGNGNCVCNTNYVGSPAVTGCYICSSRDANS